MIEIYRNSTEYVGLTIYSDGEFQDATGEPTVTLYDNDTNVVLADDEPVFHDSLGHYSYVINLGHTQDERTIRVVWSFMLGEQSATKVDYVSIVTPYATPDEIISQYPELASMDVDQIKELEKRARLIIDAATGQSFGLKRKTMTLRYGDSTTFLTEPAVEIETININGYVYDPAYSGLTLDNNGWILRLPELWNHVYYASWRPELMLARGARYNITGLFGYRAVPMDIRLATTMLVPMNRRPLIFAVGSLSLTRMNLTHLFMRLNSCRRATSQPTHWMFT